MKVSEIYSTPPRQAFQSPTPQQIETALQYIPPDIERDEWASIGMAIKSELGDTGFELFDDWSKNGDTYKTADVNATWQSINGAGGVTIKSLFKLAIAGGYKSEQKEVSLAEQVLLNREAKVRVEKRQKEEIDKQVATKEKNKDTATLATKVWREAKRADPSHPYLKAKNITGKELRQSNDTLLVPMFDTSDKLWNVERITAPGQPKKGLKDGRRKDLFYRIPGNEVIVIAEGYATTVSCNLATGWTTLCAFGKTNLEGVAKIAREKKPNGRIIIAGDVGSEKSAQKAATAINAEVVFPSLNEDGADFNDLHVAQGLDAVKQELNAAVVVNEWPDFIPLDTPDAPQIDLNCLPSWAGDYARALSIATETPPELAAGMVLVTCAAAAARRLNVMVMPGYFEPCNIWVVVALVPGNRKSSVQEGAAAPLIEWEGEQLKAVEPEINNITSERKTMEARINLKRNQAAKEEDDILAVELGKKIADMEADLPEIPTTPQLWTSDATPERLGAMLANQDECMAWLSSEGGIFDLLQGRYSGGIPNLDLVLKAHSGDAERVDRGSRPPVFLRNPRLSIGLSPQPDVLAGLSGKPGFRGRGLLGRFLYLLPPSPLGYRHLKTTPVPDSVQQAYRKGVRDMLDWKSAKDETGNDVLHVLKLSEAAYLEWHEFAKAIEVQMRQGESMEHITDWAGKAPGAAIRLAGVMHGIKHTNNPWDKEVGIETMNEALEIMSVFTRHSLSAFGMMGADPAIAAAKKAWHWIERNRQPSFTVREIFQGVKGTFHRVKEVRQALDLLEERGYVEVMEDQHFKPGRPSSPTVQVRPEIYEKWV